MLATRDKAVEKFSEYVRLARGDSYLVYLALSNTENPTDADVRKYIEDSLKKNKAA
jgi:hypothetical protein